MSQFDPALVEACARAASGENKKEWAKMHDDDKRINREIAVDVLSTREKWERERERGAHD